MYVIRNGWTAGLVAVAALAGAAAPLAARAAADAPQNAAAPWTRAPACRPDARHWHRGRPGWDHGRPGWHRGGRPWEAARMFRKLGLTGEQRQAERAIMQAARPDFRKLRDQMRANSTKLRKLTPDDKDYSAVAAEVGRDNGSVFAQIIEKQAQVRAKMYAVLTPAQKKQLADFRAQMRSHQNCGCAGARMAPADGTPPPAGQ